MTIFSDVSGITHEEWDKLKDELGKRLDGKNEFRDTALFLKELEAEDRPCMENLIMAFMLGLVIVE